MLAEKDKRNCIVAADFVLLEIERFQKLFASGSSFPQIFGDGHNSLGEFTAKVKHAETGREYTCGQEGLRSFKKIASLALQTRDDAEDFDTSELTQRLQGTFLSFVFADTQRELDSYIEEWIATAIRYVHGRHRTQTHYIPCVALQIGKEDTYSFGPITFLRKSLFRDQATLSFQRYEAARSRLNDRARRNAAPGLQWCWERSADAVMKSPKDTFEEFTKGVDWIAKIRVPRCSNAVSEARAEKALRAALAAITLLLQGTEGAALRLSNDPFLPPKTIKLASIGDGIFRASSSLQFGSPAVEDGWQQYLADKGKPVLDVIEHLLQQIIAGKTSSFGFQIALRAVTWYADAIRDSNVETRLTKCATAIECLLFPEPRRATATFVIRGSLLAQRQGAPMRYWAPIARRLYERRSDVAHGNVESLRGAQDESSRMALEFTRNVVLQFFVFCRQLQPLGTRRVGIKKDFLDLYRECEATFHDEIAAIVNQYGWDWNIVPKPPQ
jgi:hypothetical protein